MNRRTQYGILLIMWYLLMANTTFAYTHADTLRGSNGPGRSWWNVLYYNLWVNFDTATHSIQGSNTIIFTVIHPPADSMQIDMQEPMDIDEVKYDGKRMDISREGNVYWVKYPFHTWSVGTAQKMIVYYHGTPVTAKNPPWDGGFVWTKDSTGKPWIAVACQGKGASLWWPCKDAQWDEPDSGMMIALNVPAGLQAISNGRLKDTETDGNRKLWVWQVKSPINNYDATFYLGDYIHWNDTLQGENGTLDLDFYALRYNEQKARKQFVVVKPMLHCFEYWMGPYPFYEDGYKLVEAPYLGMEHQSAIAYGNEYKMGYLGRDRSNTGVGLKFDFIIVHESGHEWFGNSITAKDIADNWIHEGITTYTETLFAECLLGKKDAFEYCRGEWHNIRNDRPVTGDYGVNDEGSGDEYDKGAALMQMIRVTMNNDEKFRQMLRQMNVIFYHKTVTAQQIEQFINDFSGINFTPFFNQYLHTTDIPRLDYTISHGQLQYRLVNAVDSLQLPLAIKGKKKMTINATPQWQVIPWKGKKLEILSKDYLVE